MKLAVACRDATGPYSLSFKKVGSGHNCRLSRLKFPQSCRMWCVSCSASPQGHKGEGTTFNFMWRCFFSLLCPVRSLKMVTCSGLVSRWRLSFCAGGRNRALVIEFSSARLTALSSCSFSAPSFARSSAFSFPYMPQWEGIHCSTV